jgi:hypothetical protein
MVLGAVGCVGAWFEKKALLFIVNTNHLFIYLFYLFFSLKYIITMIVIFVVLLLGVVFVIAFNERVNIYI